MCYSLNGLNSLIWIIIKLFFFKYLGKIYATFLFLKNLGMWKAILSLTGCLAAIMERIDIFTSKSNNKLGKILLTLDRYRFISLMYRELHICKKKMNNSGRIGQSVIRLFIGKKYK